MDFIPGFMVPLPEAVRLTASRRAGASAGAVATGQSAVTNPPPGYRATLGRIELVQPLIPKLRALGQNLRSPFRNTTVSIYCFTY